MLEGIIAEAKARGATDAVAAYSKDEKIAVETREGQIQSIKNPVSSGVSIRVYFNQKSGAASVPSTNPKAVAKALDSAIENAQIASDNPYAGVARPDQVPQTLADPQIYDSTVPTAHELAAMAIAAEQAALAVDPRIQPGDKSFAEWERSTIARVGSNGFKGGYSETGWAFGTTIIAETAAGLETNFDYSQSRIGADLKTPEEVGKEAASKLLEKLDAVSPPSTGRMPVVFSPDAAKQLVSAFAQAVDGEAVAKGQTFLKGKQGQQVFPSDITITDDPSLVHGMGSKPFDREGIAPEKLTLVENGVLKGYLLNLEAARQLGLESNGRASGITNLSLTSAHAVSPDDLIADIDSGFYVTEIQGHGAHIVEGEFSQAARGRWITGGHLGQAVNNATIAGKLSDMFGSLQAANDVNPAKPESSLLVPTIRVAGMTVGG
jgi:PmbA protein